MVHLIQKTPLCLHKFASRVPTSYSINWTQIPEDKHSKHHRKVEKQKGKKDGNPMVSLYWFSFILAFSLFFIALSLIL